MSTEMDDIDRLLSDILDDSKPLPTQVPVAQAAVNVATNAAKGNQGQAAMDDPESFLESLMNDAAPPPSPMDVAQPTEVGTELVLADIQPAPPPPESHSSVTDHREPTADEVIDALMEEGGATAASVQASSTAGVFTDSEERTDALRPLKMPVFTADDFAETMDIRNFATLVTLNTARWHAKVKDRQASQTIAKEHSAEAAAFETRKHLLGGANDALKKIHRAIDEARAAHYELTLPWTTTSMTDTGRRVGGRLLPNTLFVEYTTVMAQKKQAMKAALDAFEPLYPKLVEEAKKKLGTRFDAREYPNVSSIRRHFNLSFDFQPIPKGDDYKGLPQAQLDALAAKINENTRIMAENAMQDVWCRLYEHVARMAERLSSPDKLFHNSLVQHVRDTARLVSHLNVTGDQRVEAIRRKVEKYLCQHEPKVLRENPVIRAQVAAHAQSIIEEMNNAR